MLFESIVLATLLGSDPSTQASQTARCAAVPEDGARLACYDALFRPPPPNAGPVPAPAATVPANAPVAAAPVAAGEAVAPTGAASGAVPPSAPVVAGAASAAAAAPGDAAAAAEADFGLTESQRRAARGEAEPTPPERIRSRVRAVSRTPEGRSVIELENGQVWRQVETDPRFQPAVGGEMTVRPASMGSFLATMSDGGRASRVRRVR